MTKQRNKTNLNSMSVLRCILRLLLVVLLLLSFHVGNVNGSLRGVQHQHQQQEQQLHRQQRRQNRHSNGRSLATKQLYTNDNGSRRRQLMEDRATPEPTPSPSTSSPTSTPSLEPTLSLSPTDGPTSMPTLSFRPTEKGATKPPTMAPSPSPSNQPTMPPSESLNSGDDDDDDDDDPDSPHDGQSENTVDNNDENDNDVTDNRDQTNNDDTSDNMDSTSDNSDNTDTNDDPTTDEADRANNDTQSDASDTTDQDDTADQDDYSDKNTDTNDNTDDEADTADDQSDNNNNYQRLQLEPFSLAVDVGGSKNLDLFRQALELYLLDELSMIFDTIWNVRLIPLIESQSGRRQLSETYDFTGTVDFDEPVPHPDDLKRAQSQALQDSDGLQSFLDRRSDLQGVRVLSVTVGETTSDEPVKDNQKSKAGLLVGLIIAVLILVSIIGYIIYYYQYKKPPPPPPLELEIIPDVDMEQMETVLKYKPAKNKAKNSNGYRETDSVASTVSNKDDYSPTKDDDFGRKTSDRNPGTSPQNIKHRQENPQVEAVQLQTEGDVAYVKYPPHLRAGEIMGNHGQNRVQIIAECSSCDDDGTVELHHISSEDEPSNINLNLTKAPTYIQSIDMATQEERPPPSAIIPYDDATRDDSTLDGIGTIRSILSNDEESMAGYSLATDVDRKMHRSPPGPQIYASAPADVNVNDNPLRSFTPTTSNTSTVGPTPQQKPFLPANITSSEGEQSATGSGTESSSANRSASGASNAATLQASNIYANLPILSAQNNGALKWLTKREFVSEKKCDDSYTSDSESAFTYDGVGGPGGPNMSLLNTFSNSSLVANDTAGGFEVGDESLFMEEDVTESSYKEGDDIRGDSSVISGVLSDSDVEGIYTTPGQTILSLSSYGPTLGRPNEDVSDEEPGLLLSTRNQELSPNTAALRNLARIKSDEDHLFRTSTQGDSYSDVPSDERNDMMTRNQDQDLTGFVTSAASTPLTTTSLNTRAATIMQGLSAWSPERRSQEAQDIYDPYQNKPNSPMSHSTSTNGDQQYDDDNDRQTAKERKRIKRAARKNRAERKQPPVTMEV